MSEEDRFSKEEEEEDHFAYTDMNRVLLRACGKSEKGTLISVMDAGHPNEVILLANYNFLSPLQILMADVCGYNRVEISGTPSFFQVYRDQSDIKMGTLTYDRNTDIIHLVVSQQTNSTELTVVLDKTDGLISYKVKDSAENVVAKIKTFATSIIQLEFYRKLTENEKILVLAETLVLCINVYKINKEVLPPICVSCSMDADPRFCGVPSYRAIDLTYLAELDNGHLAIRAAGYNSLRNIVYFDVIKVNPGHDLPFLTLECTPTTCRSGMAKIVARSRTGSLLFSAFNFSAKKTLAIYHPNGSLMAYQCQDLIKDDKGNDIINIKVIKQKQFGQSTEKSESKREYSLDSIPQSHFLTKIKQVTLGIHVSTPSSSLKFQTPVDTAIFLSLGAKIYCDIFKFDGHPIPEITYCYDNIPIEERYVIF